MSEILSLTDLFLPSGDELHMFVDASDDGLAIQKILDFGVTAIVHKQGSKGARYIDTSNDIFHPAFTVEEIDPTGAGDCFGGTFTALWLQNYTPAEALALACASGALAVTKRGPMEGTTNLMTLTQFLKAAA